jgi:2-alkyl-3-oxoalkanoate reductase
MKVFVAGATGAVGKRLVPMLVAGGHDVVGMTRSSANAARLRSVGAQAVSADALDAAAVRRAVLAAAPEVVIHQLTALTDVTNYRNFDREFAATNRLRTEGTDHLLRAALEAGARRFVAQSYGSWTYQRTGSGLRVETDPYDPAPPKRQTRSLAAIRHLEQAVLGAAAIEGVVLRYGAFYGPGTNVALDGDMAALVRKRKVPIIGDGRGVWTFCHVDDAASAAIAAMGRGAPGAYNIGDDQPMPVSAWAPVLAEALGAKPPRHVPVWLGRLVAGEVLVSMMTRIEGMSNAKAKRELGWTPKYPSVREGFSSGLSDSAVPLGSRRGAAPR